MHSSKIMVARAAIWGVAICMATGAHCASATPPLVVSATDAPAAIVTGTLRIETPTIRATPAGAKVAAGYLRITNTGTMADRLVGASVPFAARVEVHEMSMSEGVMKMRALADGLAIAPGQTVELKPGSFHLMFQDLRSGVTQGETVTGTLRFEKAGDVPVRFSVGGLGAGVSPAHAH